MPASSAGPGIRPIGVSERSWSPRPDCQSLRPSVASVSMNPGAKTLTRTVGANACAYDFVTPSIPYFAAAYCGARALPRTMTVEPMFTMLPWPCVEHPRAELVDAEHRALDVDGEDVVDRLLGDVAPGHLLAGDVADVVDQHVDAVQPVERGVGHRLDLLPVDDVGLEQHRACCPPP